MKRLANPTPVMPSPCATCIFRERGERTELAPGRLAEIQAYLLRGTPHLCHKPQVEGKRTEVVCRGGRDFQLTMWHRMGILPAATDEALQEAVERHANDTRGKGGSGDKAL